METHDTANEHSHWRLSSWRSPWWGQSSDPYPTGISHGLLAPRCTAHSVRDTQTMQEWGPTGLQQHSETGHQRRSVATEREEKDHKKHFQTEKHQDSLSCYNFSFALVEKLLWGLWNTCSQGPDALTQCQIRHWGIFKHLALVVVLPMITFLTKKADTSSNLYKFSVSANSIPISLLPLLCWDKSKIYFLFGLSTCLWRGPH